MLSLLNVGPFFVTVPILTPEMNPGICQAKLSGSNSVFGFYLQSSGVSSGQCPPPPWESRVVVLGGILNISHYSELLFAPLHWDSVLKNFCPKNSLEAQFFISRSTWLGRGS